MKRTALFLLVILSFGILSCHRIKGSGHIITEARDVTGFERVSLAIPATLRITQGDSESLSIEADDNILKEILTEVHGKELFIRFRHSNFSGSVRPSRPIRCDLSCIRLSEGSIDGSGHLISHQLSSEDLKLIINGSGSVRIDSLSAEEFSAVINGSGSFDMAGSAPRQDISINGTGRYDGRELKGNSVKIDITGSGRTLVNAEEKLDVSITGRGDVRYTGNPVISRSVTGSGSIHKIGETARGEDEEN